MTAQLIIANSEGIAIASDSAVTLGNGVRTFNSAEKIIPLPRPHKLAVLQSGFLRIHGVPYQVLLNEWFSSLENVPLATVENYRKSFLDWLETNLHWFSQETISDYWYGVLDVRLKAVRANINSVAKGSNETTISEALVTQVLHDWKEGMTTFDPFEDIDIDWVEASITEFDEEIDEILQRYFSDISFSDDAVASFVEYLRGLFSRTGAWHKLTTLAFVGFGQNQLLPSFEVCQVAAVLRDRLLFVAEQGWQASGMLGDMVLRPLGQSTAIELFLHGYELKTIEVASDKVLSQVETLREKVMSVCGDKSETAASIGQLFESVMNVLESEMFEAVEEDSKERYVNPLIDAIAALPISVLADVARSLIELQGLRQTTKAELGTVGGPTDVAVISRAKGFQWIMYKDKTEYPK